MTDRDDKGQFQLGHTGQGGRPKGSRNKLGEAFVSALCEDFAAHGTAAIVAARESDPVAYVRVLASILPRQIKVEDEVRDLSDAELMRSIRRLVVDLDILQLASTPLLIEGDASDLGEGEAG